jgi:hypothetical protein
VEFFWLLLRSYPAPSICNALLRKSFSEEPVLRSSRARYAESTESRDSRGEDSLLDSIGRAMKRAMPTVFAP